MDALRLLTEDHVKVKGLMEDLAKTRPSKRREELFGEVVRELRAHERIEEEIF